jgi:glycosyltransferase involved in cell wall biosynthesis
LPLVLLEALVRGRPVVATAVGGVADVVEDGVTGTLVPPGDAPALAAALEQLQRKADRAWRMGRAGAERVRERFTWPAVIDEFESVYDEVLGFATVTPESPEAPARGAGKGHSK